MTRYRIAEIGGDGIGPEVVAEAVRVLEARDKDPLAATAGDAVIKAL